jgi:predicted DNA-binding ribbon-helix-helix protein
MRSPIIKRSVVLDGHKTSVSLEHAFWSGLRDIADSSGETVNQLIARIDAERNFGNLSSAIRLFVLEFYRDQNRQLALRCSEVPCRTDHLGSLQSKSEPTGFASGVEETVTSYFEVCPVIPRPLSDSEFEKIHEILAHFGDEAATF